MFWLTGISFIILHAEIFLPGAVSVWVRAE